MKKNSVCALFKNGYDVDFVNKEIKITKEFREQSGNCSSEAFKIMMTLRSQLPDFKIVEVNTAGRSSGENKNHVQGLTMEFMRVYIEDLHGEGSDEIKEFEKILGISKSRKSARYAYMKQWFNANYPDAIKLLGGIPDAERRAARAAELHNQAKQALAAAKEMQNTLRNAQETTDKTAADLTESAGYKEETH